MNEINGNAYLLAGVVAFGFWLLQRGISAADRRQEEDRKEIRNQGKEIVELKLSISRLRSSVEQKDFRSASRTRVDGENET